MKYKLITVIDGEMEMIKRINDNSTESFIPINAENTDYQAYLAWLDEGNTPEPAEE